MTHVVNLSTQGNYTLYFSIKNNFIILNVNLCPAGKYLILTLYFSISHYVLHIPYHLTVQILRIQTVARDNNIAHSRPYYLTTKSQDIAADNQTNRAQNCIYNGGIYARLAAD